MPPRGSCWAAPVTPIGTADTRKRRSPHTIGEADPRPGTSTFHRTFFVSLHSSGGLALRDTPLAYGPRHCAQFFSWDGCAVNTAADRISKAPSRGARTVIASSLRVYYDGPMASFDFQL